MSLTKSLVIYGIATSVAALGALMWIDVPSALYLRTYEHTGWFRFFWHITDLANGVIWYSLAAVMLAITFLRRKFAPATMPPEKFTQRMRAWLFMVLAMASSGLLLNALKVLIGRERPRVLFREGSSGFNPFTFDIDSSSFPSGHTQSICAAMFALWFVFPPLRPLWLTVAVLVSASRVVIGAHFLSDVIGGAFVGISAVLLWRAWFERAGVPVNICAEAQTATAPSSTYEAHSPHPPQSS